MSEWPSHGGQPERILARFGLAPGREMLDFSANLNPLGPPEWLAAHIGVHLAVIERYPDPDYREACRSIARAEGIDVDQVRLTNGGAEAIFLAAALHAALDGPRRAGIVQPTFGEYARACRHYGLDVFDVPLAPPAFELDASLAVAAMARAGVVFLCRPNNPSGTLVSRELVSRMLEAGQAHGSMLVVDEAFVDFVTPDERLTPLLAHYDNLILLRSMTKLYALPGLRLGYLLATAETIRRIAGRQMPWSVNALAAGLVAPLLEDVDYPARTHAWLEAERPRLQQALQRLGLRVAPSRANFLLFRPEGMAADAERLFEDLLRESILLRHTQTFPGLDGAWLRVAIRGRDDNRRLLEALARVRMTR
ncbi:threonine-phosphate decarboxylase CobD [Billgrantia saliphila]|uniref:threonine-phosphate decarboxylase CobD n=1 Tax=Billgrantia saliphila TaxID=1848458 RepID=UPI000CE53708|nr:threonine-phosphate decarboxylase CobD [Halomonas saliphila]